MKRLLKNSTFIAITMLLIFSMASCGGGVKANPATDFSYEMTADKQGIVITKFTGDVGKGKIVVPATIEGLPVLEIGEVAFEQVYKKEKATSIIIPNTVREIGNGAFMYTDITSFSVPDSVKKIGCKAFANTKITKFYMPDSVTELVTDNIGMSNIFDGCKELTEIRLSDNLQFLPDVGFSGKITKFILPKNLKAMGPGVFKGCGELTELIIPDTITSLEFLAYGDRFRPAKAKNSLGDNEFDMFKGCGKLPLATRQKLKDLGYQGEF